MAQGRHKMEGIGCSEEKGTGKRTKNCKKHYLTEHMKQQQDVIYVIYPVTVSFTVVVQVGKFWVVNLNISQSLESCETGEKETFKKKRI